MTDPLCACASPGLISNKIPIHNQRKSYGQVVGACKEVSGRKKIAKEQLFSVKFLAVKVNKQYVTIYTVQVQELGQALFQPELELDLEQLQHGRSPH